MRRGKRSLWVHALWVLVLCVLPGGAGAQERAADDTAQIVRELKQQVAELQAAIRELRAESSQYRAETQQLRTELQSALGQVRSATPGEVAAQAPAAPAPDPRLVKLQEEYDLLSGKVDSQYQTKIESGSKYPVRLSGLVLLNLFSNRGAVDNQDLPTIALTNVGRTDGSFGGTVRQSQLGLEVFGPTWRGARIKGNLQLDLAGGFPDTENGVTMGIMRLRTAVMRMDWPRTSVVAGQDAPFFSPLSPTSLASLAQPALSYSGNLWSWMPQLRVEHRFAAGEKSNISVQAGIIDPLTGEEPYYQFQRISQAGEASRQPGYATRVAWSSSDPERPASFGIGAYYSRQNWRLGRMVDGWAATADWSAPLGRLFSISGEFYRGRAIGGLGGGIGNTVLFTGPSNLAASRALGLDAVGGWTQLKLRASSTVEFNTALGQDNPFANEFRRAPYLAAGYPYNAIRNRSLLTNVIYRPRSDLLLSLEYRRIQTFNLNDTSRAADQVNLVMGVLF